MALVLLVLLLAVSAWRASRPSSWTRLVATGDGGWWLFDREGRTVAARLRDGGLNHPWLVTLPLRLECGRRCVVAVCADQVPADRHAALRRWMASGRLTPCGS